ncbi:hypothetical protein PGT21_033113 [Puccinia graminis f. sp. tritici]|uniref:3-hydroxyisobutyrate dehydrogenase n=1 Tax=Puccinia graminis f. sp. tritici TaxID=56615 RepID=A0A5B0QK35_PUCGR|nr:hypothetical protein PGT21_033113 [Puccinia graminis f. sp. tritici]
MASINYRTMIRPRGYKIGALAARRLRIVEQRYGFSTTGVHRMAEHRRENSIGFIGLGAMGQEMASNLLSKFPSPISAFVIHDHSQSSVARFVDRHPPLNADSTTRIVTATTPASVARQASTIVTMLPSSAEVSAVYLDPNTGILRGINEEEHSSSATLCIDSTTLDVGCATTVSEKLRAAGAVEMIDAPVSGGVVGAREGTLTFMCGGPEETFNKAQPFLNAMGKKTIYCGKSGSGLAAKLTNNMLLAVSMIATSEAMLLGQRLGLKPDLLARVINSSSGRCWSSEINNPAPSALLPSKRTPADDDWQAGFASRLMAKDLGLALQAEPALLPEHLPVSNLVKEIYLRLTSDPAFSNKDFSVVYDWLQNNHSQK